MVHCVSFNCNSIRKNTEIVKTLLKKADILCLQEIMLTKDDLGILNQFNSEFEHVAFVNEREVVGICEGRPTAGVAIFWRRKFSHFIKTITIDDSIIGILLNNGNNKVLIMNVYLPCDYQNMDALDRYRSALAKLESVIREQNVNDFMVIGDFNADPFKGRFWRDLLEFCSSLSLSVLDTQLPNDSFTYLCPSYNRTSWLDHILSTCEFSLEISNIFIDYGNTAFDHFPLHLDFNFSFNDAKDMTDNEVLKNLVKWNTIAAKDVEIIKGFIDAAIDYRGLLCHELFSCPHEKCSNPIHLQYIDDIFEFMKTIQLDATREYSVQGSQSFKIIPGWNDNVKHIHAEARKHFFMWMRHGKPQSGIYMDNMKLSRSNFKRALNECKANENEIRRQKLLDKLHKKDYKGFWKEVDLIRNNDIKVVDSIDGVKDNVAICEMFSDKYKKIFTRSQCIMVDDTTNNKGPKNFRITYSDVNNGIKLMCIGMDGIHSNHLKFSSDSYQFLISELFSSFSKHEYVPKELIKGTISPTIKDKFGDLRAASNYRPVMLSSVFFKLLEYCLLPKVSPYIQINDWQHGFRSNYSTSTACFILKETVLNYFSSGSDVHACFIDISKAFDSVNHDILMKRLLNCGIPSKYVTLLQYIYKNQFVNVRYKSCVSQDWKVNCGVRQGGVLSGLLFSVYINCMIESIANMRVGCKLGLHSSNIIAYADDIVLLAPSFKGLQLLLDKASEFALDLELKFNSDKSKYMVFRRNKRKLITSCSLKICDNNLEKVENIKYLGFTLNSNLRNNDDICRARRKFYSDFNSLIRKFNFASDNVKIFLFKQFCTQFYGGDLWFYNKGANYEIKQFAVGYHKAIKKLLGLSTHESNHFACQEATLLTFEHLLNKIKVLTFFRFLKYPCIFIQKVAYFLDMSSVFFNEVKDVFIDKYEIEMLMEQDREAIISRLQFVQNHEGRMREGWS